MLLMISPSEKNIEEVFCMMMVEKMWKESEFNFESILDFGLPVVNL